MIIIANIIINGSNNTPNINDSIPIKYEAINASIRRAISHPLIILCI